MKSTLYPFAADDVARVRGERQSQRLVTAFVIGGLFFMLLPGTFLGVWNLLGISQEHQPESIPAAWLQAHGQAQIFGWIGSFILGIGFYSLTKMKSTKAFPVRAGWTAWVLWTVGVLLRWYAGVTGLAWRLVLPLSGAMQLAGFAAFYFSVKKHRTAANGARDTAWMSLVASAALVFLITLIVNEWLVFILAAHGSSPALPHALDQQLVVLAVWGVLVPTIWGFNARWLPVFLGLRSPNQMGLCVAYALSVTGVILNCCEFVFAAEITFLLAALFSIDALHVWNRSVNPPKVLNVHPTFPLFVRFAYGWLLLSCGLALLAVFRDSSGGIWGASRHALTVGFVALMVFTIGQRVLPAFCGMRVLWSSTLMLWSLIFLIAGCFLRVAAEPIAYENIWAPAWKLLPVSAIVELAAVSLFALNLGVTLFRLPPKKQ